MSESLKELKRIAHENACWLCQYYIDKKCTNEGECVWKNIGKGLEALEIIKKKNVFVWGFIHRKEEIKDFEHTYDYYKTHYGYFHSGYEFELLTEEEFELLKEVLL